MALQNIAGANIRTPLNTDFRDAPVGQLNGRRIEQVEPQEARASRGFFSRIGDGISSLASRVASIFTSESARTERQFRQALSETSQHVATMLGALSFDGDDAPNADTVLRLLAELPDVATPVTRHGHTLDNVMAQRLEVHLAAITPEQRSDLLRGIATIQNPAPPVEQFMEMTNAVMVRQAVDMATGHLQTTLTSALNRADQIAQIEQAMQESVAQLAQDDPNLATTQDQLAHQQTKTYKLLGDVNQAAHQLIEDLGFHVLPKDQADAIRALMVKQALEPVSSDPDLNNYVGSKLISHLPTQDLLALYSVDSADFGLDDAFTAQSTINGAIGVRAEKLETILARQSAWFADPANTAAHPDYTSRLGQANQTIQALDELNQAFNLRQQENISQLVTQITDQVEAHTQTVMSRASDGLQSALAAAGQGNYNNLLRELDNAQTYAQTALDDIALLGTPISSTSSALEFRETIILGALRGMSDPDLANLAQNLETPTVHTLHTALMDAAVLLLPGGKQESLNADHLGRMLFDRGIDLELLRTTTQGEMTRRGLDLPPPAQPSTELNDLVFPTIRHSLNVQLGMHNGATRVEALPVSPELQERVNEQLHDMINTVKEQIGIYENSDAKKTEVIETIAINSNNVLFQQPVHNALRKDLPRATYIYQSQDSNELIQLDREGPDFNNMIQQNVQTLFDQVANANPQMMHLISHFAQQEIGAPLLNVMMFNPDANPVRTADGIPMLVGTAPGMSLPSIYLIPDNDGGVTVYGDINHTGISMLQPQNVDDADRQPALQLDEGQSYQRYSCGIHIDRDMNIQPAGPALHGFDYTVLPPAE